MAYQATGIAVLVLLFLKVKKRKQLYTTNLEQLLPRDYDFRNWRKAKTYIYNQLDQLLA